MTNREQSASAVKYQGNIREFKGNFNCVCENIKRLGHYNILSNIYRNQYFEFYKCKLCFCLPFLPSTFNKAA